MDEEQEISLRRAQHALVAPPRPVSPAGAKDDDHRLVIPANAGIQFYRQARGELDDTPLLRRALRAITSSAVDGRYARMFASASCLRSPAFAGMTGF